jgi:peroxidase
MTLHTIFVREHNRIAAVLAQSNPSYDSDEVFHKTRQIVVAELQKITFKDYLPLVLGNLAMLPDYQGYDPTADPRIPSAFNTAAFRFGHSQIQPDIIRLNPNYGPFPEGDLHLADTFFNTSQVRKYGVDAILRGLITDTSQVADHFFSSPITHQLVADNSSSPGQDLVSLNLQRGRDHGLPPYTDFKQWARDECGAESDFTSAALRARLIQLYGSMDSIDLFTGGLAEQHLSGALVGATFACVIYKTFTGLRDGDRFYYEREGADSSLTTAQIQEINSHATLSRLICENTDIDTIQENAFLVGQTRVNCDDIPPIDLSLWGQTTTAPHQGPKTILEILLHLLHLLGYGSERDAKPIIEELLQKVEADGHKL